MSENDLNMIDLEQQKAKMENKETEKWGGKEEKEKWEKKEMENRDEKEKKENIENVLCIINYWSHLKAWDSRISNMLSML